MSANVRLTLSYYPWINQRLDPATLAQTMTQFATLIEAELSQQIGDSSQITVLPPLSVPDQIKDISEAPSGPLAGKIALMNPIGYALIHEKVPEVEAVSVVLRKIGANPTGPTYRAQIYTNVLTGIKSLADLRKRSFAFGSPQSTSNFLVPAHMLWRAGLHPMNAFSRLEFAGGHDLVAKAVYEGRVDAGAGHDGVIIDLATKLGYSNAAERLVRIEWSEDIPSDPVVVNVPDATLKAAVLNALLAIAKPNDPASPANVLIGKFWGTTEGLAAIDADEYRVLLPYMEHLSIRPEDVLQPF